MQTKDSNEGEKAKFQTFVLNDTKYKTLLTPQFENRKPWIKPDPKKMYSYLPGTIQKIYIKEGDKIKNGDVLMIFEAMKMVNTVKSEQAGIIKEIFIKAGDKVPKGALLFEFE
jgi:biotin carboxyl carrier protein